MAKVEKAYNNTYSFPVSDLGLSAHEADPDEEDDDEDTEPNGKHREDNTEVTKLLDNMHDCVKEGGESMERLSKVADDTTRSLKRRDSRQTLQSVKSKKKG